MVLYSAESAFEFYAYASPIAQRSGLPLRYGSTLDTCPNTAIFDRNQGSLGTLRRVVIRGGTPLRRPQAQSSHHANPHFTPTPTPMDPHPTSSPPAAGLPAGTGQDIAPAAASDVHDARHALLSPPTPQPKAAYSVGWRTRSFLVFLGGFTLFILP